VSEAKRKASDHCPVISGCPDINDWEMKANSKLEPEYKKPKALLFERFSLPLADRPSANRVQRVAHVEFFFLRKKS